ncbi:MAG: ribosome modulation factor [Gammaproteobacteria bacterium]|nr:ribosome modulation factor [Gammaproteobacteria bacterium]NNJ73357.1 ribosome modulation factor [Enterobacterales bacterium]
MKRQKRNRANRAHSRGFNAALLGRTRSDCPFKKLEFKEEWLSGWREARGAISAGYF